MSSRSRSARFTVRAATASPARFATTSSAPVLAFLESAERPEGFFVSIHAEDSSYLVGERTLKIEGAAHVREKIGDLSYLISPTAFFQPNVAAATVLQSYVVDAVGGASRVLDRYCGTVGQPGPVGCRHRRSAARGRRLVQS